MKRTIVLGIACFYHDSAAALIVDGNVVAAAQEERFSRIKHDASFPREAITFCLESAGVTAEDIDYVAFYEKPIQKFDRLLRTYIATWPWGLISFVEAMLAWSGSKFWIEHHIRRELDYHGDVLWVEHHLAHAASAFYCSPFERAAIMIIDGVGERDTTTIGRAHDNSIELLKAIEFPHSLGLLYSALTYYLGFAVNADEYKVMGLAPYGDPSVFEKEFGELVTWKPDGSFRLNMQYFAYEYGTRMITKRFEKLFDGPARLPGTEITQRHKDIAATLQTTTEKILLAIAAEAAHITGEENICISGGVGLNCVANGKIAREGLFKNIYVPFAPGDAGGCVGAALYIYFDLLKNVHSVSRACSAFLGPEYSEEDLEMAVVDGAQQLAVNNTYDVRKLPDDKLFDTVAELLEGSAAIGWFQGRMEFGPRALGNRSIIADPRIKENWQRINMKIKFRESFRPLAPAVLTEKCRAFFDFALESPYMSFVAPVISDSLPAVTHVDGSARLQTIRAEDNPRFHALITAFEKRTGCPVLINTSFNARGEPIVMTPRDALQCFFSTDMDHLVLGKLLISKK